MSGYGPRVYGYSPGGSSARRRVVRRVDRLHLDPGLGLAPVGGRHGESMLAPCASSPACCSRSRARRPPRAAPHARLPRRRAGTLDVHSRRARCTRVSLADRAPTASLAQGAVAAARAPPAVARRPGARAEDAARSGCRRRGCVFSQRARTAPVDARSSSPADGAVAVLRRSTRTARRRSRPTGSTCSSSRLTAARSHRPRPDARRTRDYLTWCGGRLVYAQGGDRIAIHAQAAARRSAARLAAAAALATTRRRSFASPACDARRHGSRGARRSARASTRASSRRAGSSGASGSTATRHAARRAACRAGPTSSRPGRRRRRRSLFVRERNGYGQLMLVAPRKACSGRSRSSATARVLRPPRLGARAWARVTRAPVRRPARARRLVTARDRGGDRRRRLARARPRRRAGGLLYAVNKEYAERDRALADGDEVALIPPVSGGAFLLSDEPLSLDRVVDEVRSDDAGAIATFTGTTRIHSRGRDGHAPRLRGVRGDGREGDGGDRRGAPRALRADARSRSTTASAASTIGETSVVIAVSAPHRAGRARRVQGRDRRAEGARAALEERGLRGRRRVDRAEAREPTATRRDPPDCTSQATTHDSATREPLEPDRSRYEPIHRRLAQAALGPADRRRRRSRSRSSSFVLVKFCSDLHRRRGLRADLGLEVRGRRRRS